MGGLIPQPISEYCKNQLAYGERVLSYGTGWLMRSRFWLWLWQRLPRTRRWWPNFRYHLLLTSHCRVLILRERKNELKAVAQIPLREFSVAAHDRQSAPKKSQLSPDHLVQWVWFKTGRWTLKLAEVPAHFLRVFLAEAVSQTTQRRRFQTQA